MANTASRKLEQHPLIRSGVPQNLDWRYGNDAQDLRKASMCTVC